MVTVKEYADGKGVTTQSVYKQLKKHSDKLTNHIVIKKNKKYLDDFACDFLDSLSSSSSIDTELIDGSILKELEQLRKRELELLNELNIKNNLIIQLQQNISKNDVMLIEYENESLWQFIKRKRGKK